MLVLLEKNESQHLNDSLGILPKSLQGLKHGCGIQQRTKAEMIACDDESQWVYLLVLKEYFLLPAQACVESRNELN